MSRQEAFEKIYAKLHDVTPDSLVQYRFCTTDGYRLPQMASHYRVYCETMDSLAGKLQDAERYRWLRVNNYYAHVQVMEADGSMPYVYAEELDRCIDFAVVIMSAGDQQ